MEGCYGSGGGRGFDYYLVPRGEVAQRDGRVG